MDDYIRFDFTDKLLTFVARTSDSSEQAKRSHYDILLFKDEKGNIYKYPARVDKRGRDMTVFGKCCRKDDIGGKYYVSGSAGLISLPFDGYDTDVYEIYEARTETRFVAECAV